MRRGGFLSGRMHGCGGGGWVAGGSISIVMGGMGMEVLGFVGVICVDLRGSIAYIVAVTRSMR